jgi:hypothetical protein
MKPRRYAEIATVILLAQAAFAIVHRITGSEYGHFAHLQNVVVDVGLAVIWLAGALACAIRGSSMAAFLAVLVALAVTHIHGVMFSVAAPGKGYGVPFLVTSALLPLLLALSAPAWKRASTAAEGRSRSMWPALHRPRHA